jgi:hypothetical protein
VVRPRPAAILCAFEKHQQLLHRHAPSFIRHVLDDFGQQALTAVEAAEQLGLSPSRLYALSSQYLRERAQKRGSLSFGEISFHLDSSAKEVEIMIEKGDKRLPISRIGSGLQQVLFLISNIIYNENKMIGIEEIELNLSPQSQRDVFEMIKALVHGSPKLVGQVLVTSHSPYFQNRADVKYYSVDYSAEKLRTEVTGASTRGLRRYFAQGNQ